eukprot:TRINITY_DN82991_c0_g1_i1.p1 TRINITY_DN82991_c0_g1~~TRINITY_DN82991_c0_g1_i1.p1  ORF type:complete len:450 (+),score=100.47 TRINITY_DN82991_c0_g1_i1:103-1452(+)
MSEEAEEFKKKGNEAFKAQNWDEAIKHYNKAISLEPQAAYYSNRAACWSSKGNHDSALLDATKCLERDPDFIKGYSRKGKALFDLKRYEEAEDAYRAGLEVDSSNAACAQGLAEVKATRNRPKASSSGSGTRRSSAASGGFMGKVMERMKSGGLGGRMGMYVVAFGGYYIWKNFLAKPPGTASGSSMTHETESSEFASEDGGEGFGSAPSAVRRGFSEVRGQWISYLEAEGQADTLLVMLHRTSLSAEAEFEPVMNRLLEQASDTPSAGLRVVAPDRPCHGYSPCTGLSKEWLKSLLATRRQSRKLAVVAVGREAAAEAFQLVRQKQVAAEVLLVSPKVSASSQQSAEDLQSWLKRQSGLSDRALADAARWVSSGAQAVKADLDVKDLPEGCVVSVLHSPDENEDKALAEELELVGVTVRNSWLSEGEEMQDMVAKHTWKIVRPDKGIS